MSNTTRLIPLTQGKSAIVDEIDYQWLTQWKWYASKSDNGKRWYARRDDKQKCIFMHRVIADRIGLSKSRYYDHKDRNGINNTRDNIRACSQSQNNANRSKRTGCSSKYKGIYWHRKAEKWHSLIQKGGRRFHLGLFDSEEAAAVAYMEAAVKLYGEFAFAPLLASIRV